MTFQRQSKRTRAAFCPVSFTPITRRFNLVSWTASTQAIIGVRYSGVLSDFRTELGALLDQFGNELAS